MYRIHWMNIKAVEIAKAFKFSFHKNLCFGMYKGHLLTIIVREGFAWWSLKKNLKSFSEPHFCELVMHIRPIDSKKSENLNDSIYVKKYLFSETKIDYKNGIIRGAMKLSARKPIETATILLSLIEARIKLNENSNLYCEKCLKPDSKNNLETMLDDHCILVCADCKRKYTSLEAGTNDYDSFLQTSKVKTGHNLLSLWSVIVGVLSLILLIVPTFYNPPHSITLMPYNLIPPALLFLCLLPIMVYFGLCAFPIMKNSLNSWDVSGKDLKFFTVFTLCVPGFIGIIVSISPLNKILDNSIPRYYNAEVVNGRLSSDGQYLKRSCHDLLKFNDYDIKTTCALDKVLPTDEVIFNYTIKKSVPVTLEVRDGFFGAKWISKINPESSIFVKGESKL